MSTLSCLNLAFIYLIHVPSHNVAFDCCQTVTNQQVTYIQQPQHTFAGGQGGMVIIQPTSTVTTTAHGYPVPGQPAMYLPQQVSSHYYLKLCEHCSQLTSHVLNITLSDSHFLKKHLENSANDCIHK